MKNDSPTAKTRILSAALNQFHKKGFDGARVDEIAKEAGVNKALIYYYFESKEKILEAIFEETANRFISELGKMLSDGSGTPAERHVDGLFTYRHQMKDIVKVAFTESLKDNRQQNYLFELTNNILSGLQKDNNLAKHAKIDLQARIVLFFFVTIPELSYIMLGEKWAEYNNVSREETAKIFKKTYKKILSQIITMYFSNQAKTKKEKHNGRKKRI
jgi:AcrR family transcriptional regulator